MITLDSWDTYLFTDWGELSRDEKSFSTFRKIACKKESKRTILMAPDLSRPIKYLIYTYYWTAILKGYHHTLVDPIFSFFIRLETIFRSVQCWVAGLTSMGSAIYTHSIHCGAFYALWSLIWCHINLQIEIPYQRRFHLFSYISLTPWKYPLIFGMSKFYIS